MNYKIGVVGLGVMGHSLALNMERNGFPVAGYDLDAAKTTTVASLGAALVERGRKVLLVDLDAQSCLTFSLGIDPEEVELSVHDVLLGRVQPAMAILPTEDGVDLLPATIELAGTEAALLTRPGREFVLRTALEEVADAYDVILLDCSPSLGVLTLNALTAADDVIIPLQCEMLSHRGVGQLLDTITDVKRILSAKRASCARTSCGFRPGRRCLRRPHAWRSARSNKTCLRVRRRGR